MSRFLKVTKLVTVLAVVGGVSSVLYLQEWGASRTDIPDVCRDHGIPLPLENARIVIDVSDRTLTLFAGEVELKRYDVGVGRSQTPGTIWRDSGSTPLGDFTVVAAEKHVDVLTRGSRFLQLSFPREEDVEGAWRLGRLSEDDYDRCIAAIRSGAAFPEGLPIGGRVGIQGNNFVFLGSNVTGDGSVALYNRDVNELYEYVGPGTPVEIRR